MINGFEGLVLKDTKTGSFYRYKQTFTGDYVITGIEQSDSDSYAGIGIKGFKIGLYVDGNMVDFGNVGSGMPYEMRVDAYKNPDKYIGQTIECSGKAIFKSGMLRHPSFVRLRTDKPSTACTLKQFNSK
jgi:ATP-dependent DNA ligase